MTDGALAPCRHQTMTPHLFVYGTLLSSAGHPMGARLEREGHLIGQACLQGLLYRLGPYPGLIETDLATARVHGEVFKLDDPPTALAWLDAYEGIRDSNPKRNDYRRVERVVRLNKDREITAWVYLYQGDTTGLPLIADGRWAP
jgi:gamma-glutamylcyclotransferase (GGCT)/AIG2-like uncharacterized protein YtfP